jgi:thymidylate synthase
MSSGGIPVLTVRAPSLAEGWERSLLELWEKGCDARTDYDERDDAGRFRDAPSKDCSMCIVVEDPASEPFIHRAFPGGLEDLEEYRQEVVEGIKDHWVRDFEDPTDTRWEYTYHGRLFAYDLPGRGEKINQIENSIVGELCRSPHSRRANAITWQPWRDGSISHPPCLQSIWCRMLEDSHGNLRLNMNVRFRSRDAYDAAFMNMFALIHLQEYIAGVLGERGGRQVLLGRYVDWSDSYHIYGRRLEAFQGQFLKLVKQRSLEERTWTRAFARPFFEEAKLKITEKVRLQDERARGGKATS